MNKSFNKRKNNNNKFDKSQENFKINMNNMNNLANHNYEKGPQEEPKREETKNAEPEKAKEKTDVQQEEEKPLQ